jgi:glycosyltransferase involved in cell wall biosynthesis
LNASPLRQRTPNILLLSQEIPHSKAAGSILLKRLFDAWPATNLAVYGPAVPAGAARLDCQYVEWRPPFYRIQFSKLSSLAPSIAWMQRCAAVDTGQFAPDVVVTVMQSTAYYAAAYRFARKRHLPLVLVVHDDPEEFERAGVGTGRFVSAMNARIYGYAIARLCVSPELEEDLRQRYGVAGWVQYPNRSRALLPRNRDQNTALKRANRLVIGYAGSLKYGYGNELQRWLHVFARNDVVLRIYSPPQPSWNGVKQNVEFAGYADTPEVTWERLKAECDAVLLPYHDDPASHVTLYRTHFPSKLTEYLALGMPVIISGPSYAAGVRWGKSHTDACITLEHPSEGDWARIIHALRTDQHLRIALGDAAAAAGAEFDPRLIEQSFHFLLRQAVHGGD